MIFLVKMIPQQYLKKTKGINNNLFSLKSGMESDLREINF